MPSDAISDSMVELRGPVSAFHVSIMDAVCKANPGMTRTKLMQDIVRDWCDRKIQEAILVQRMLPRNGIVREPPWESNGDSMGYSR